MPFPLTLSRFRLIMFFIQFLLFQLVQLARLTNSLCSPCYDGPECNQPRHNPPVFSTQHFTFERDITNYREVVTSIIASDTDSMAAFDPENLSDCQVIEYDISYTSMQHQLFTIDSNGNVYFKSPEDLILWTAIVTASFTVTARNRGLFVNDQSSATVSITSTTLKWILAPETSLFVECSRYYPQTGEVIYPNSVQVVILSTIIDPRENLEIQMVIESEDFFDSIWMASGKLYHMEGTSIAPGSQMTSHRSYKKAGFTIPNLNLVDSYGFATFLLYFLIGPNPPSSVSLTFSTTTGNLWVGKTLILKASQTMPPDTINPNINASIAIDEFASGDGLMKFVFKAGPLAGFFHGLQGRCDVIDKATNQMIPKVFRLSPWNNLNLAYPNVYTMSRSCHTDEIPFGTTFFLEETHLPTTFEADLYVLLPKYQKYNGEIVCSLGDARIPPTALQFTDRLGTQSLQSPKPYNLMLKIVHARTQKDINSPLQAGEYVLVLFKFKLQAISAGDYEAYISFLKHEMVSIFCPHVVSVGKSILWADRTLNCLTTQSSKHPNNKVTYKLGYMICLSSTDNEVTLGAYVRVKFTKITTPDVIELRGHVMDERLNTAFSLSTGTPVTVDAFFSLNEFSFSFQTASSITLGPGNTALFRIDTFTQPNIYFNEMRFMVLFVTGFANKEHLILERLQFIIGENYAALSFSDSQTFFSNRVLNETLITIEYATGPTLNTGCAFLTKNYLPNIKADIITIEAAFRLTDAPDIAPNAKYSIEFRCFANTRLLKSLTATVVAQREQDPLLKIDIHFFNKQIVRRGEYVVDLEINNGLSSNLQCHNSTAWFLHGGLLDVNLTIIVGHSITLEPVPLPNNNGFKVFAHGEILMTSRVHLKLAVRLDDQDVVKRNKIATMSTIVRCRPFAENLQSGNVIYEPPLYFYQHEEFPSTSDVGDIELNDPLTRRSYLDCNNFIVFCEATRGCFAAFDEKPRIWKFLGKLISYVKAYLVANNTLIAFSNAKDNYLISTDFGSSWTYVSFILYRTWLVQSDLVTPTAIMLNDQSYVKNWNYFVRKWTIAADGIYFDQQKTFSLD